MSEDPYHVGVGYHVSSDGDLVRVKVESGGAYIHLTWELEQSRYLYIACFEEPYSF